MPEFLKERMMRHVKALFDAAGIPNEDRLIVDMSGRVAGYAEEALRYSLIEKGVPAFPEKLVAEIRVTWEFDNPKSFCIEVTPRRELPEYSPVEAVGVKDE